MGKLRDNIMKKCPEDFEYDLKDFIDTIEDTINSAKNEFDMDSPYFGDDMCFDILSKLADDLY